MQLSKKAYALSLSALLLAPMLGCGGSATTKIGDLTTTGPAGKVTQSPVSGATIWADDLTSGSRFVIDSSEQATKTTSSSTGLYTIPLTPKYKYVLISQGGTDTITGKTAVSLLAPGGAQVVSPFTTLVELDALGLMPGTLNAVLPGGRSFDTDISSPGALTPDAMVFLTSVVTAVTTINATITDAAAKSAVTLTPQQISDISLTQFSFIARQFAPGTLATTATIAQNLNTALCNALTAIAANNVNIVGLSCSLATTVANDSVAVAANVVGNAISNSALKNVTAANVQTAGVVIPTSISVTEATVLNFGTNVQLVDNLITSVAASSAAALTVTATPSNYNPPPVPVILNPTVIGYNLLILGNGNQYAVHSFTITFSDDMIATSAGSANYGHSVLNPANYTFSQGGCTPSGYTDNTVSLNCGNLTPGNLVVTVAAATATTGVWASGSANGLVVNTIKTFHLQPITGSTSVNLF